MYPFIVFAIFAFAIAGVWHGIAFDSAADTRRNIELAEARNMASFAIALHEAVGPAFFDHDADPDTAPVRAFAFSRDFIADTQGGRVIYDEREAAGNTQAEKIDNAIDDLIDTIYGCGTSTTPNPYVIDGANFQIADAISSMQPPQAIGNFCGFDNQSTRYGYALSQRNLPWKANSGVELKGDPLTLRAGKINAASPFTSSAYMADILALHNPDSRNALQLASRLSRRYQEQVSAYTELQKFAKIRKESFKRLREKLSLPDSVYIRAWLGCALQEGIDDARPIDPNPLLTGILPTEPGVKSDPYNPAYTNAIHNDQRAYDDAVKNLCSATKTTNPLALVIWLEVDDDIGDGIGSPVPYLSAGAINATLQKLIPSTVRARFGVGALTSDGIVRVVGEDTATPGRNPLRTDDNQDPNLADRPMIAGFPNPTQVGLLPRQEVSGRQDTLGAALPYIYKRNGSQYDGTAAAQIAFYSVFPLSDGFDISDLFFPAPDAELPIISNVAQCSNQGAVNGATFDLDGTATSRCLPNPLIRTSSPGGGYVGPLDE